MSAALARRPAAPRAEAAAVDTAYLHPGEIFASARPCTVTTILGSCVAACLWDAETGIGGLTHHLLPHGAADVVRPGRFGNLAIPRLVERLVALGARPGSLRAKLFGGACVLDAFRDDHRPLGGQNVDSARAALAALSIPVVAADVEGRRGRRLLYGTADGVALVRLL
ncbi:MAG TPA: chemotaxis protein CheD [Longimicrobium sp.]|jgi:chemotaxis protein CheD|uniref:chemotaxis protein CheD n=1 Tax=Longimicrobium sp. TaxID=2029185 RepID=UPI002ED80A83